MRRGLLLCSMAGALLAGLLVGCSGSGPGPAARVGPDRAPLRVALSRIAAIGHGDVTYDDTGALVSLAGRKWYSAPGKGFSVLRGYGAGNLVSYGVALQDSLKVSMFDADYSITTGTPPKSVGVLAGGQAGASLATLRRWGWKQHGDRLVAPRNPTDISGDRNIAPLLAQSMAQVRVVGDDLVYGQRDADLGGISVAPVTRKVPSGASGSLDDDPTVGALAGCLGDVVAAQLTYQHLPTGVTAAAVGVRRPDADTDTPHAVVCVSWSNSAAADRYASKVTKILATGTSVRNNEKYSQLLTSPKVHNEGGAGHVVSFEADTPHRANLILQMLVTADLPGLADCSRLPPAVRAQLDCP